MSSYLIYHPKRIESVVNGISIFHDGFQGNQDPYIWNERFLHTYCHITQLKNQTKGSINFWVSAPKFPEFDSLNCDCVFVVDEVAEWQEANRIHRTNPIIENDQCFEHHYKWANEEFGQHQFMRKKRITLKAEPDKSYQPLVNGRPIDIIPFLKEKGYKIEDLVEGMKAGFQSKPLNVSDAVANELYEYIESTATTKNRGSQLTGLHPKWKHKNRYDPWVYFHELGHTIVAHAYDGYLYNYRYTTFSPERLKEINLNILDMGYTVVRPVSTIGDTVQNEQRRAAVIDGLYLLAGIAGASFLSPEGVLLDEVTRSNFNLLKLQGSSGDFELLESTSNPFGWYTDALCLSKSQKHLVYCRLLNMLKGFFEQHRIQDSANSLFNFLISRDNETLEPVDLRLVLKPDDVTDFRNNVESLLEGIFRF